MNSRSDYLCGKPQLERPVGGNMLTSGRVGKKKEFTLGGQGCDLPSL